MVRRLTESGIVPLTPETLIAPTPIGEVLNESCSLLRT